MQPKRILIVDDEDEIREVLNLQLSRKGFCCDLASGVAEAHKILAGADFTYDVILCDYSMKDGTGLEVFELIPSLDPPLFVLISGFSEMNDEELTLKGIPHILHKPVRFKELLGLIQGGQPNS